MVFNWRRHIVLASSFGVFTSLVISYYNYQNKGMSFVELFTNYGFLKNLLFSFILSVLIYGANLFTSVLLWRVMDKRVKIFGVSLTSMLKNTVYFINGIITSVLSYYLFLGMMLNLFYAVTFQDFYKGNHFNFGNFLGVILLSVFILLIVFAFTYNDQIRILALQNKEMEIALQKSQIESMKEQLSPHFLFNNLNVLISTIQEDPLKAEKFARSFSKIYRYVLEKLDATSCTLADELSFIKDYVYLLNVRYDNAIAFEVAKEVAAYNDVHLPTLSLQILIENVVKHNTIPSDGKIKVLLRIEDGELVLWNEKSAKPKQVDSSGLGLLNLSKRCELLCGKDISISDLVDSFSVNIPLFNNEKI